MAVAVLVAPMGVSVGLATQQGTPLPQVPSEAKKGLSPGGGCGLFHHSFCKHLWEVLRKPHSMGTFCVGNEGLRGGGLWARLNESPWQRGHRVIS